MKIGELAGTTGVGAKTIRYYELVGLLAEPERTDSGYRLYTQQDTERLDWYFNQDRFKVGPLHDGYGAWDLKAGRYPKLLFTDPFPTLRQAIDAARAATDTTTEEPAG